MGVASSQMGVAAGQMGVASSQMGQLDGQVAPRLHPEFVGQYSSDIVTPSVMDPGIGVALARGVVHDDAVVAAPSDVVVPPFVGLPPPVSGPAPPSEAENPHNRSLDS